MSFQSFLVLHSKLSPSIKEVLRQRHRSTCGSFEPRNVPPVPNGTISTSVRLAVALRYFAGGSPTNENCTGIQEISSANFDVCAGAIDGILIWTHKPTQDDCNKLLLGQKKFLCGRKHKFGLNCQAVCDARGRFLDLSICLGGASSDCLAFEHSSLHKKLELGMLAEGLCLFGDNAYINKPYMATPYINQDRGAFGSRDNYNYYHSQVRIRIECAFGIFTERWGILRSAMPKNIRIKKTISLVVALAKLHNFCIDVQEPPAGDLHPSDYASLINNADGHVSLVPTANTDTPVPIDLMHGGDHFDDVPPGWRNRQYLPSLPRQRLHDMVQEQHLVRPRPRDNVSG